MELQEKMYNLSERIKQLKENIEYNKSLYVKVVNKIEKTLEKNKERVG